MPNYTFPRSLDAFQPIGGLTVDQFKDELNNSLTNYYPSREVCHYRRVRVLLVSWDHNGFSRRLDDEIEALERVFSNGYNYDTKRFKISISDSEQNQFANLVGEINLMTKDPTNHDLFIFFYGGHGNHSNNSTCIFESGKYQVEDRYNRGQMHEVNDSVDFYTIRRQILDGLDADILLLLDCCHASAAAINFGKELIAACDFSTTTISPGYYSFTRSVIQELTSAEAKGEFLTAARLHAPIVNPQI